MEKKLQSNWLTQDNVQLATKTEDMK